MLTILLVILLLMLLGALPTWPYIAGVGATTRVVDWDRFDNSSDIVVNGKNLKETGEGGNG
jgi:hypothetical protein